MHDDALSKEWERRWARRLPADAPWIVRLDGRGFHRWTKGLRRPFDDSLRDAMVAAAEAALGMTGALHAYTQSDEVTLVLRAQGKAQPPFGGKLQKLVSLTAAAMTTSFNASIASLNGGHAARAGTAMFDARAFAVPDEAGAIVALEDRRRDCRRNAVQSVGQWKYGHKRMLGTSTREAAQWLEEDGLGMTTWPARHTGGVALARKRVVRKFDPEEIERLPPRHAARANPDLAFERTEIARIEAPDYRDTEVMLNTVFGRGSRGSPEP